MYARTGLEYLEGRTDSVSSGATCTCQLAIRIAVLNHETTQVEWVLDFLGRLLEGHTFGFTQLEKQIGIFGHLRIVERINNSEVLTFEYVFVSFLLCHLANDSRITDKDKVSHFIFQQDIGCFERARFVAFGKHNALRILLRTFEHLI